jgi:uncharacterized protein (DUF433 family)
MPAQLKRYISVNQQVLGGTPVIKGTRIPIERLSSLVKQGYDLKAFKEEFPQVESQKIQNIISYLMQTGLNAFTQVQKI